MNYKYALLALLGAVALAGLLVISGCGANFFACTTKASFSQDGTWSYESCKNQENFEAEIGKDARGNLLAKVKTSATTPEAAIAAAAEALKEAFALLKDAIAIAKTAGSKGVAP